MIDVFEQYNLTRFVADISENKARVCPVIRIGSDVRIIMRAQIKNVCLGLSMWKEKSDA